MKYTFVILTLLIAVILFAITRKIIHSQNKYKSTLIPPIITGLLANVFYSSFLMVKTYTAAIIFDELYFICTDYLTFTMLLFSMTYTEVSRKQKKITTAIFGTLSLIDSLFLLCNTTNHLLFDISPYYIEQNLYWHLNINPLHYVHLFICYIMVAMAFIFLIYKCRNLPAIYRNRFLGILIAYGAVIVINMYCYSFDLPLDYSVLFYAVLAGFISFHSMYSAPRQLTNDILVEIYDSIKDAVIGFNTNGYLLYSNKKASSFFNPDYKLNSYEAEQYLKDKLLFIEHVEDKEKWDDKIRVDDEARNFSVECQKLYYKKRFIGSFLNFKDTTVEVNRLKKEKYIATHDELTGLYNRSYFFEQCAVALRENKNTEYIMLCSNIKDFKLINELFGQEKGNEVLKKQAELLRSLSHPDSIYGRIVDDKFGLLMNKEIFNQQIFEKSIEAMGKLTESSIYQMHIYIGIYEVYDRIESPEFMYDKSLLAVENIQNDYQTIFSHYNTDLMDKLLAEKNVLGEFDKALRENQFCMYLQGQFARDGSNMGAEALVRWIHPTKGLISPGLFIPILENTGLIYKLDKFIWEEAAKKLSEWKKKGITNRHISVNISAKDFFYVDIYKTFVDLVEKYDIDPRNLKIEITETVLMTDFGKTMELFHMLQKRNFEIEIDDFGSGYSSLNMLKDIKANVLKIDMGFLRETENHEKSRIILETIISMSKNLGMEVVCEGVEKIEQIEMLSDMGCNIFQGYYFSKPIPVAEYESKFL